MKIKLNTQYLKKYIKLYNITEFLFRELGPKIRKMGYFTFDDFYAICTWKTRRAKNQYLKNNKNEVERITKLVLAEKSEYQKMKTLCELRGVSIPVASAMLAVVNPSKYGIIDIRCLEMLAELGENLPKSLSIKTWEKFLEIIRKIAKENKITPREVDMALFAMHREKLDNIYRNLYL